MEFKEYKEIKEKLKQGKLNNLYEDEIGCNNCKHYIRGVCSLKEKGCQTETMESYQSNKNKFDLERSF